MRGGDCRSGEEEQGMVKRKGTRRGDGRYLRLGNFLVVFALVTRPACAKLPDGQSAELAAILLEHRAFSFLPKLLPRPFNVKHLPILAPPYLAYGYLRHRYSSQSFPNSSLSLLNYSQSTSSQTMYLILTPPSLTDVANPSYLLRSRLGR